jgi:hypothetical protein
MNSFDKKALNIAGIVAAISIAFGLFGWWLTHEYLFINFAFIAMGINSIYFSNDLAMERVVKFKLNYKFARGAYVFVGLVFVATNTFWLISSFVA